MAGVDTTEEVQKGGYRCTINLYVLCETGCFICTDSRCTYSDVKDQYKDMPMDKLKQLKEDEVKRWYIHSENNQKLFTLELRDKTKIGVTLSGEKDRCDNLWSTISHLATLCNDIDDLAINTHNYLQRSKNKRKDTKDAVPAVPVDLFMAGFSTVQQAYVVAKLSDNTDFTMYNPKNTNISLKEQPHPSYNAIGSGSDVALQTLGAHIKPGMTYESALKVIASAMVNTCMYNVSCGGNITVKWISQEDENETEPIKEHFLDMMLKNPSLTFEPNMVFYFSFESNKYMNYDILDECLESRCSRFPMCLGEVTRDKNWKMFIAVFPEKADLNDVFLKGKKKKVYKDHFYWVQLSDAAGKRHSLIFCEAKVEYLKDMRDHGPECI